MPNIALEIVEDGIGLLTIDRPERRNALDDASVLALIDVLESESVQDLGAIVLVGAGKHFCAGIDLSEIGTPRRGADRPQGGRLLSTFRSCPPVIIGAIHGCALGLGCGVAMACDLVIASDDVQLGYPAVQHGLVNGVTLVGLREVVGARIAMELLVTGRRVGAEEALRIGMVNAVVPAAQLRDTSMELARTVAGHRRAAVHATKQLFHETSDLTFAAATKAGERMVQLVRKADDPERLVAVPAGGSGAAR